MSEVKLDNILNEVARDIDLQLSSESVSTVLSAHKNSTKLKALEITTLEQEKGRARLSFSNFCLRNLSIAAAAFVLVLIFSSKLDRSIIEISGDNEPEVSDGFETVELTYNYNSYESEWLEVKNSIADDDLNLGLDYQPLVFELDDFEEDEEDFNESEENYDEYGIYYNGGETYDNVT